MLAPWNPPPPPCFTSTPPDSITHLFTPILVPALENASASAGTYFGQGFFISIIDASTNIISGLVGEAKDCVPTELDGWTGETDSELLDALE